MDIQTAAKILGINRTRNHDLKPMVKALEMFSFHNTSDENDRLNAAKFVLRNWKEYQEYCNEKRNLKGKQ
jgi:hypothetical protein